MNNKAKIAIAVVLGILSLCVLAALIARSVLRAGFQTIADAAIAEDPAEIAEFAAQIGEYNLPLGYHESMAMNMFFLQMVVIEGQEGEPLIMLMHIDAGEAEDINPEELRLQMQLQVLQANRRQNIAMHLVEETSYSIRGQETVVFIYEGIDENGQNQRQLVSGVFNAVIGQAMLMIMGDAAAWDQAAYDEFIASIR
jgi:hypothetical protein